MTGRDVPTRQKTLSVAFSAIMVLSMVAVGMAGFAGSAAALEQPAVDESASSQSTYGQSVSISANPATPGASSTHTITLVANSTQNSNNLDEINIDYGTEFDLSAVDTNNDVTVDVAGSSVTGVNAANNSGTLEVDFDGESISSGDVVTVTVGPNNHVTNAENGNYDIDVTANTSSTDTSETTTVPLQLPGPVQVYNGQHTTDGTPDGNFTSISDAEAFANTDSLISVGEGEFRERDSTVSISTNNVTVSGAGADSTTLNVSSAVAASVTGNNVAFEDIAVDGADSTNVIEVGSGQDTFSITDSAVRVADPSSSDPFGIETETTLLAENVAFSGEDQANEAFGIRTRSGADDHRITDSTFDDLDVGVQTQGADNTTIENNDFTNISDEGVYIVARTAGSDKVDIASNTFTNTGSGGFAAISLENNGDDVGIVNVTDNTVTDAADNGLDVAATSADVTVDSLSVDNASTGVLVTDTNSIDIDNADVNGTSTGIQVNEAGAFNLTNSVISNTDNRGLYFNDPSSSAGDEFNVHFNEFTANNNGIAVDDNSGDFSSTLNLTFNDVVDNDANGLNVETTVDGSVNANYSWWDNRDSSRIVGPYTPQDAEFQLLSPRRVYSYTRLHTGGQP